MLYSLHGKLPTPNMVGADHVIFPPTPKMVGADHVIFPPWKTTNTQHGRSGPCYIPSMENYQHPTW
jgi:hypothetical protein